MKRDIFMKELEFLLQDVPDEDKADALQYYRDYLDEAGPEQEETVIREFGSPERIAAMIRAELAGNLEHGGEFTDSGYRDERFREPNYQVAKRLDLPEVKETDSGSRRSEECSKKAPNQNETYRRTDGTKKTEHVKGKHPVLRAFLMILLIICAVPALLGVGTGMIGVLTAVIGVLAAIFFGLGLLTICAGIGGVVLIVIAIVKAAVPATALLSAGVGIMALGACFLGIALSVLFYGKMIPALVRTMINPISRFVNHRRGR